MYREGSMAQRDKGTAGQCIVRKTGKHSKEGSKRKGRQENIQNFKRSIVGHRNRESRYV